MVVRRIEGLLQRWIRHAVEKRWLLSVCGLLAALGTLTAAFPVTAVVVPAALLVPSRWWPIAFACTIGSTVGATLLVEIVHHVGWQQVYEWLPQLADNTHWQQVVNWVQEYGVISLFVIAASPLPQTPALVFFGISGHAILPLTLAIFAGKILKYSLFAWLCSHFPERFYRPEEPESTEDPKHETQH